MRLALGLNLVEVIALTCHVQGIFDHANLPVDTPNDRHTSNGEESDEPNPLGHIHLQSGEYDYWDGEECEVEKAMNDVECETILHDTDTFHCLIRFAIGRQIPVFQEGTALEQFEED